MDVRIFLIQVVDNMLSARLKRVEGDLEKGSLLVNYEVRSHLDSVT